MTVDAPSREQPSPGTEPDAAYRYPGSPPFRDTELDRRLFRGRAREAETVLHSVLSSDLFLVYAESGLGKTSLINAGVVDELRRRGHWPASVRLNDTGSSPVDSIRDQLEAAALADGDVELVLGTDDAGAGATSLWDLLASLEVWRGNELQELVVIFDQFEELFTLDWDETVREEFIAQFGEVVRGHRRGGMEAGAVALPPPRVKFVLVIREDSLGALEALATQVPGIMRHRFRLGPLDPAQAESAVREPALIDDGRLDTQRFEYTEAAAQEILDFLRTRTVRGSAGLAGAIDPSQLQIVCQYVERSIVPRKTARPDGGIVRIDAADLGGREGLDRILGDFYRRTVEAFPHAEQPRIRRLCEEGLINRSRRRLSLEEGEIVATYGVTVPMLHALVDHRLLRADPRVGSIYYELAHDTLVQAVLADRDERLAQRRRRRNRVLGIIVAVVAVVAFTVLALAAVSDDSGSPEAVDGAGSVTPPPPRLTVGEPRTATFDDREAAPTFALAMPDDGSVQVVVEPDEQLDVAVEVTDPSGATRRVDQLGNGGTEVLVIPPGAEGEGGGDGDHQVRVTAANPAGASFRIAAEEVDAVPAAAGDEVDGEIADEGEAAVVEVELDPSEELVVEVTPLGDEDKATLDVTIEVLGPSADGRALVDVGGPGVVERTTLTMPGRTRLVVRGKSTTGDFTVSVRDSSQELAPGEAVVGAIDETSSVAEYSLAAEQGAAHAVLVQPAPELDVVLEVTDPDAATTRVDRQPQGVPESAVVVGSGGEVEILVGGFESSIGSFVAEVSQRATPLPPEVPTDGEGLTVFAVDVAGGSREQVTIEPGSEADELDVQVVGPDGTLARSTLVAGGAPTVVELDGSAGTHLVVVAPRPTAEAAAGSGSGSGSASPYSVTLTNEEEYAAEFEQLFNQMSRIENRTERYMMDRDQLQAEVFGEGAVIGLGPDAEAQLNTFRDQHRELMVAYVDDVRPRISRLETRMIDPSPFGDLASVRDRGVAHYRTWVDFVPEYQVQLEEWTFDALNGLTTLSFDDYSSERLTPLDDRIDTTFVDLCAALAEEQPSSVAVEERLADFCRV